MIEIRLCFVVHWNVEGLILSNATHTQDAYKMFALV